MSKTKVTVVRKDQKGKNRRFNIDLGKLSDDVLSALEGIEILKVIFYRPIL